LLLNKVIDRFGCYHSFTWLPTIMVITLTAGLMLGPEIVHAQTSNADPDNKQQVSRGALIYKRFCSLCHGANLEGQPKWRIRKKDGKLPAPPHDETGHTWHHADDLLFGITKQGLVPPYAPANYKSDMPAWGDTLKDEDIWAVLAYIKSRWPAKTRKIQAELNKDSRL
jgi:mono/diheme cytochrome c family protein